MPYLDNVLGSIGHSFQKSVDEDFMHLQKPVRSVCDLARDPTHCSQSTARPTLAPMCAGKEVDLGLGYQSEDFHGNTVVFDPRCAAFPSPIRTHHSQDVKQHLDRLYSYYLFVYSPANKTSGFLSGGNGVHHTSIVRCKRGTLDTTADASQCDEFAHVTTGERVQDHQLQQAFDEGRVTSYPLGHLNDNWQLDQIFYAGASSSSHQEVFGIDQVRAEGHSPETPVDGNTTWFSSLYHLTSVNCNAFSQFFLERFLDSPDDPLPPAKMQAAMIADHGYGTQAGKLFQGTLGAFYDKLLERRIPSGAKRILAEVL